MAAEHENRLFVDIRINVTGWFIELEPRVRLETHEANLSLASHKEHNVAICLLALFKQPLFDHLRVIYEANELPFAEVDYSLRHIQGHMHYCYLFVHRSVGLVSEERIVNDPGLINWLLWKI